MSLRDEFHISRFGFKEANQERFLTFHWRLPGFVFVTYRLTTTIFTISVLVKGIHHYEQNESEHNPLVTQIWGAYLTNWTYCLLTLYYVFHGLITICVYSSCPGDKLRLLSRMEYTEHKYLFREIYMTRAGYQHTNIGADDPMDIVDRRDANLVINNQESNDDEPLEVVVPQSERVPWYLCLLWIIFNTVSVFALVVSIMFWTALAPHIPLEALTSWENLHFHLFNSLLILIEHLLTAMPVRLLHSVFPFVYGVSYCVFSLAYWADDHTHIMYPVLDWEKNPGLAVGVVFIVAVVLVPGLQFFFYGIHRLKLAIFRRLYWS